MEKEVSPKDTIRIVRVALKCADALIDFDVVNDLIEDKSVKYVKHGLKKDFLKSGYVVELFSSEFLTHFVKEDENTQMELQKIFREFSEKIKFMNEEMTALVLYYSKLKSIIDDLNELKYNDPYISYLLETCLLFTKHLGTKYKTILERTDREGHGVEDIIKGLNKLGKTIMY
jgi:hypothetical protein